MWLEKWLKGAEATCVKISAEMKICFRLKDMLNFNVLWNFWPIYTCFTSIIWEIINNISSLAIPSKFMLPFWNFKKLSIFFRTTKLLPLDSWNFPKFPWHSFCMDTNVMRRSEMKIGTLANTEGTCSGYS